MTQEEFKKICEWYLPGCTFKDNGTCGLCCYHGGEEITDIQVALLPRGEYAVYDQWRDCTITADKDYMIDFLRSRNARKR